MKKMPLTIVILLIFSFCSTTTAIPEIEGARFSKYWTFVPDLTLLKLMQNSKSDIIGTSGLSWPDGRQAIILHIKSENYYYRVIEYYDKNMQQTGSAVYKLNLKSK